MPNIVLMKFKFELSQETRSDLVTYILIGFIFLTIIVGGLKIVFY